MFDIQGSWLSPVPCRQIAETVHREELFKTVYEGSWLGPAPYRKKTQKIMKSQQQEKLNMEGSCLSPHATLNEDTNSSQKSENRGQSLIFLATGDFEQMSSNIARKELKCHTGLLKVGVHQNGAQELGIIVR